MIAISEMDKSVLDQQDQRQAMDSSDLQELMGAYTQLTQRLQQSHEQLGDEVLRLREQLASQEGQLQRSRRLAAVGEMAAGIAHEIRNPLAALQLYMKMLNDDLSDIGHEKGMDVVQKMSQAVKGLNEVVSDVLTFSKEINPRFSRVNLDQLFLQVLDIYEPQIEAHHIEVQIVGDTVRIDADALLLNQALGNLIRNSVEALKSLPADRRRLLTLSVTQVDDCALLRIQDSGPGLDEAIVDRIFNPFFTTRASGTGLGLAIVHRIAEAHQGTISAFNDHGAVFELLLPSEHVVTEMTQSDTPETYQLNTNRRTHQAA